MADRSALIQHANNRSVSRNLRDPFPFPYGEAEADQWLAYATAPPWGEYAIEVSGEAAGGFGFRRRSHEESHTVEVGYWLGEIYWGRGIISETVATMTRLALAEADIYRLFAPVFSWNPASMRVLEKAG